MSDETKEDRGKLIRVRAVRRGFYGIQERDEDGNIVKDKSSLYDPEQTTNVAKLIFMCHEKDYSPVRTVTIERGGRKVKETLGWMVRCDKQGNPLPEPEALAKKPALAGK